MPSFRQWLENTQNMVQVPLIWICGDTTGTHGWGNHDEVPAGNPVDKARWEVFYDARINKPLKEHLQGKQVLIQIEHGGSWHERWLRAEAVVEVTDEFFENVMEHLKIKIKDNWCHGVHERRPLTKHYENFTTLQSLVKKMAVLIKYNNFVEPMDDEDSATWTFNQYMDKLKKSPWYMGHSGD